MRAFCKCVADARSERTQNIPFAGSKALELGDTGIGERLARTKTVSCEVAATIEASLISVFRPGTFLTCLALDQIDFNAYSTRYFVSGTQ